MSKQRRSKRPTKRRKTSRWRWIALASAVVVVSIATIWLGGPANAENADVVVHKTPTCICCNKWVAHLRDHDLEVAVVNVRNTRLTQSRVGVPRELGSCHTAKVGDYLVEGHVPADLVQRLITERPSDIRGIAVPGMPIGSPGMEGPNPVEYEVIAFGTDGQTRVYATRQGATEP